jgi:hypothetical protein
VTTGAFTLGYSGVLIGLGGHLHDYGEQLKLVDVTRNEPIATLDAKLDPRGRILSIPIVRFNDRGGFPLNKGDVVKVTATYGNPTLRGEVHLRLGQVHCCPGYRQRARCECGFDGLCLRDSAQSTGLRGTN